METPGDFPATAVECPFLDGPCPQGDLQGMQCQYRVVQDFDPVGRFHDFEVIYCSVCRKEVPVSIIPRSQPRSES